MPYTKKLWVDHIKDANGNVVQQGTPVNAANLNHIEEGIANAAVFTAGELGVVTAHSGALSYTVNINPNIDSGLLFPGQIQVPAAAWYSTWVNAIGLTEFHAFVYGTVLKVRGFGGFETGYINKIVLPDPPAEGERQDAVFLEAWRDQATQAWQTRIRTVAGVDFAKYPSDGFTLGNTSVISAANNNSAVIRPQGGLDAPYANDVIYFADMPQRAPGAATSNNGYGIAPDDRGVYVAGRGTDADKAALKTYDGYVYAIPICRVIRRNSGDYSVNNPNGARKFAGATYPHSGQIAGVEYDVVLSNNTTTAGLRVGDELWNASYTQKYATVVSITSTTAMRIRGEYTHGAGTPSVMIKSGRPDGLFADIITDRDIIDLRHKTYLIAPSYEQLLIDGTDQILRGASQVEKKTAMRKTYVGVRKTPLDANHIFYASMDGTVTAEVGTLTTVTMGQNGSGFQPMPTGAGYRTPSSAAAQYTDLIPTSGLGTVFTLEFFLDLSQGPVIASDARTIAEIRDTNNLGLLRLLCNPTTFDTVQIQTVTATAAYGTTTSITTPAKNKASKRGHFRLTYNNGTINLYIDGNLVTTITHTLVRAATKIGLTRSIAGIEGSSGSETYPSAYFIYSDVAISKIDRGAVFATLPADFIQGYADITPALNYQRRINSDAQTSQKTFASAKVKNTTQEPGITVTKGTGTNQAAWESGDKIRLRGLAGEVIGGVVDGDTALARVLSVNSAANVLTLDDVSKIAVNDTIIVSVITDLKDGWGTRIVSAVDTTNKTITLATALGASAVTSTTPLVIYETTASTSSPVIRAIISGTSTTIPGTWANLGTNEAEVTLGTLPGGLAAQEIIIEYSLNMPVGQGSLYQIYTAILGGEVNGKKLVPKNLAVTDDFVGKITANTTVTPHKAFSAVNGTAATPVSPGTEFSQGDYDAIKSLDSSLKSVTTSVNGQSAAVLISIDIIRMFEDKYGKIPGAFTVAEKVAWLKANIANITGNWYGYANGLHTFAVYSSLYYTNNQWVNAGFSVADRLATVVTKRSIGLQSTNGTSYFTPAGCIDANGFIHYLAYDAASDGTIASAVYTDHFTIDITVLAKAGYETLVPENTRRDAGLGGVLYVRKTTREVESLFWGNDEDNGIVVIGDYLPYQAFATATIAGTTDLLLGVQAFVTTAGTNRAYGASNLYANAITALLGPGDELNYKVDPQTLVATAPYDAVDLSGVLRYWYADFPHGSGAITAYYSAGLPTWAAGVAEFLCGQPRLLLYNGEIVIHMKLRRRSVLSATGMGGGSGNNFYFRLPGRPLVKL